MSDAAQAAEQDVEVRFWSRVLPRKLQRAFAAALSMLALGAAQAQPAYPTKPVRVIVPIAPGSVTDVVVRGAAQELSVRLGQPLLVENRVGASGVIGGEACARAAADGYTLCILYPNILSFNPHLFDKLPYDVERDFVPVTNLYFITEGLVVTASLPVNSVDELKSLARTKPGTLNFGTLGPGSGPELFLNWLNAEWQTDVTPIPYKGGGPVALALTTGEVQLGFMGLGNFIAQIQGGQVRVLAVSGSRRSKLVPGAPTRDEAGLGGYPGRVWWGLLVPAGTSAAIVQKLNTEFVQLFREPKFVDFLESRYVEPATGTPEEFAAFLKADRESAGKLVRLSPPPRR
jgi:tripartite-type tricarboxylate transporter receptor subunit TctC